MSVRSFGRPWPALAIVGHGRAGKDTAGDWLRDHTVLRFEGGCSWAGRHYMAERLSADLGRVVTPEEAYGRRHEDRDKWYRYLNEFRKDSPSRLIRLVLETSDFVCGVRDRTELLTARDEGLLDLILWVENPRVPPDPTVTFVRADCDLVIDNDGTLEAFYARLRRLADAFKILRN